MKVLLTYLFILAMIGAEGSRRPRYRRSIEASQSLANAQSPTTIIAADTPFFNWDACQDDSNYFNGSCYRWSGQNQTANWFVSDLKCRAEGGHLVSILSKEESQIVQAITLCSNNYWIGLVNTEYANGEFTKPIGWSWRDESKHRYTRLKVTNTLGFDCGCAKADGNWVNSYCSQVKRSYVCKKPLKSVTISPARFISVCPQGWIHYKSHCYYFSKTSVNYFYAHLYCFKNQAHVVTIKSSQENAFVQAVIGCENSFWIGFERAVPCLSDNKKKNCWEWSDLTSVVYENWRSKNPTENTNECAFSQGYWENSAACHTQRRFVCKRAVR